MIDSRIDTPVRSISAALVLAMAFAAGCGSGAPVCSPTCAGKTCGADGCGGSCGTCPSGQSCGAAGSCAEDWCGAGSITCSDGTTCPVNSSCGPDGCVCIEGDVLLSCAGEGCTSSGNCARHAGKCVQAWCGAPSVKCSDGSLCPSGSVCNGKNCDCLAASGVWQNCQGKQCDASFSNCGGVDVKCAPLCTPQCSGKSCGPDGCGGTCGSCASGQTCDAASGQCTTPKQCAQAWVSGCDPNSTYFPCCFGHCAQIGPEQLPITCAKGNTYCVCTALLGEACKADTDCADANCVNGICSCRPNGPRPSGGFGKQAGNCCSKTADTNGACCNPPASGCQSDIDCCDGTTCDPSTHKCGCLPNDRLVVSASECCSGTALWNSVDMLLQCSGPSCTPNGGSCASDATCCSGGCKSGTCACVPSCTERNCGPNTCGGGSCGTCPGGQTCNSRGSCSSNCSPGGRSCSQAAECCSGQCQSGLCTDACVPHASQCPANSSCCGADACVSGSCCTPAGYSCQGNGDCCSNNCCAGTCAPSNQTCLP